VSSCVVVAVIKPRAAQEVVTTNTMYKRKGTATESVKSKKLRKSKGAQPGWVLQERVDLDMVRVLLNPVTGLPLDHRDRSVLDNIHKHTNRESGLHQVEYYHSQYRQSGRVYASNSLQRLSRKVRDLCVPSKVCDIDITNAHPDILWQVFHKHDISAPVLKQYKSHRELIIESILQSHPELTRNDIKKAFIVAQNQGDYRQATGGQPVDILKKFAVDVKRASLTLYDHADYSEIRAQAELKPNKLGSFIFMVCEDVEIKLVTAARDHLKQSGPGTVVRVNMYDGLLVEWGEEEEEEKERTLDLMGDAVEKATTYVVKFVEKTIVRCTMKEVCNRLPVQHTIDATDKVVLFSLEGTLTYKRAVRPGAKERLALLKAEGIKVGLFTDEPRSWIDLEWLQKELGLVFDVVLTRKHCYPSVAWSEDMTHDSKHKSIAHYFPDNPNVVCIDSNPERVAKKDRAKVVRVPMWAGDENEEEDVLGKAIDRATSEVFASRGILYLRCETTESRVQQVLTDLDTSARTRSVRVLQSSCLLMGQDPRFDARQEEGKQLVRNWGKVVMYKGYIGAGKTWCVTTAVIEWIQQNRGKKVVYVVPFQNLSQEQTTNLRNASRGPNGPRIHFYRDGDPVDADKWDILVVCPMSLYKFNFTDVGLFVLDELSGLNNQLVGWIDEDGRVSMRLDQAVDIIKDKLKTPGSTILLCGAQANKFEQERILALVDIDSSVDMLMYEHSGTGPVIPIARLDSLAHAINFMWYYYMQGERVAIHFRHASDVRDAAKYTTAKALECGVTPPRFLEWTRQSLAEYKRRPHPSEDVTMYLQATMPQIMAYTTALSPGMSVNDELFERRIMAEPDTGSGAGSKVIGQMPGRMRKMKDQTILLYAPDNDDGSIQSHRDIEDRVMKKLAKLPGASVHTVIRSDGTPECRLQPGLRNSLKLEAAVFAEKGTTFNSIRSHIGDTRLVPTPTGVSSTADPLWLKIRRERGHDPADSIIAHLIETEIKYMRFNTDNSVTTDGLKKSERALFTARMLPRRFVTAAGDDWVHRYSLSNKTFNVVDKYFHQFMVLQSFVWAMSLPSMQHHELVEQYAALYARTAIRITAKSELAVLTIRHLCTLACLQSSETALSVQVYEPNSSDLAQAYRWVHSNWTQVQSLSSRNCALPANIPGRYDSTEWLRCVRRVTRTQMGVNMEKKKKKKQNKNKTGMATDSASAWFTFTAGSLWKTLGVHLEVYVPWLLGGEATTTFIVSPSVCTPCDLCDVGSGPVDCLYQGGIARCTVKSSEDRTAHRIMALPLDTGLKIDFDNRLLKRNAETVQMYNLAEQKVPEPAVLMQITSDKEEEEEQENGVPNGTSAVVDTMLKFFGFVDGARTTQSVSAKEVLSAIANNSPLSSTDQLHVQRVFGLSASTMCEWSNARQITPVLRRLAAKEQFDITSKLTKRKVADSRVYTIQPVKKNTEVLNTCTTI
jgi:hypothetical protein